MLIYSHSKHTTKNYLCFRKAVGFIHSTFSGVIYSQFLASTEGNPLGFPFCIFKLINSSPASGTFPEAGFFVPKNIPRFRSCNKKARLNHRTLKAIYELYILAFFCNSARAIIPTIRMKKIPIRKRSALLAPLTLRFSGPSVRASCASITAIYGAGNSFHKLKTFRDCIREMGNVWPGGQALKLRLTAVLCRLQFMDTMRPGTHFKFS